MPSISYDGQSFAIDGRRIWLVSGAIHYPRVPHELWRDRIRAAKQAGLNTIETYCFWNAHEPEPGQFDFTGDLDLKRFVQTIGEEGMYCILRPGPYVCAEWDNGGLPAWLHRVVVGKGDGPMRIRQDHPAFLEASARYLGAIMGQVADLQITRPGGNAAGAGGAKGPQQNTPGGAGGGYTGVGGGPIVLVQNENEWFCHNPEQEAGYLKELNRYLRENGCETPIIACNQLWQRVEGTLHTWNGKRNLSTDLRQLRVVQPDAPRLVTEYWPGWFDRWGGEHASDDSPGDHLYRMAEVLGSGSQYNLYMFHGGTNFAFRGGRTVTTGPFCFMTTSYDYDAPLLEAGGRGDKYLATKKLSTFASHFSGLFAHIDPHSTHATFAQDGKGGPLSISHLKGTQGEVIFLLRGTDEAAPKAPVELLLSDGLKLPVPMGEGEGNRVAWVVLEANLGGAAVLNYCNLRPWAMLGQRLLVVFGPSGAAGLLAVDDKPAEVVVPDGREPTVLRVGSVHVAVLNDTMLDAAYPSAEGLIIGCYGLDDRGEGRPLAGWDEQTIVKLDGTIERRKVEIPDKPNAPRITSWCTADVASYLNGTSERYEAIDGPTSLEELGCDFGYGWYRIGTGKGSRGDVMAPLSGDRLHIYSEGELEGVLGWGPDAAGAGEAGPAELNLAGDIVVLADNLGRFNYGQSTGERKGLLGHLYEVKPVKLAKAEVVDRRAPDPFELTGLVLNHRKGETGPASGLVWNVKPAGRSKPLILEIERLPQECVVIVNGHPIGLYAGFQSAFFAQFLLDPGDEEVSGGQNRIELALYEKHRGDYDPRDYVRVYAVTNTVTNRGAWAFTPWALPEDGEYQKGSDATSGDRPTFFRGQFNVKATEVPLWLEPREMSKGQIFLNGRNVGRYWMNTRDGSEVGPQRLYYLPEPWLRTDGPNELILFDEHGRSPSRCRLVYNAMGPFGKG